MFVSAAAVTLAGLVSGSLMFSAWLPRLRGRDARQVGDGNPGAVNAFRAGGPLIGSAALLLDFLKAALPVAAGRWWLGIEGWWLLPVALAPLVGHAFSPFLLFRGGKAVAATFGAWCGLTLWQGPTVLGVCLGIAGLLLERDAWRVMFGMAGLLVYGLLRGAEPVLLAFWAANLALLVLKHRRELDWPIRLRVGRRTR